jgi:rhodanese-related sulfurtransferase
MKAMAYVAAVLGGSAALAGSPYAVNHGAVDVQSLSRAIADERDHVTAVELAAWIRERRTDLRVIDVRTAEEFEAYHVPTAERIPIDSIGVATLRPRDLIVLYSEGGAHAAQAWVLLRALGYPNVYFLRGGLYEWIEQIMSPSLSTDATAKDSADFAKNMEVSRYFGGVARTSSVVPDPIFSIPKQAPGTRTSTSGAVARIRRRGC